MHRTAPYPVPHLAGTIFRRRRFHRGRVARVLLACDLEHQRTRRHRLGLGIGDHRLDQLEVGDFLAKLGELAGISHDIEDQSFGNADAQRRNMKSPASEDPLRKIEAPTVSAATVAYRHAN